MKILHLVGGEEDIGGVLSVLRNLQSASLHKGWHHEVLVGRRYKESRKPALQYVFAPTACEETSQHLKMFWQVALAIPSLLRLIKKNGYDILHAHSRAGLIMALGLSRLMKRSILFTNHNYAQNKRLYVKASLQPRIRTVLLTPNMALHYGIQPKTDRVHIISACCPDAYFDRPCVQSRTHPQEDRKIRLIGTGNIVGWKNWHLIVEALLLMEHDLRQNLEFQIWGPSPDTPQAAAYCRQILDRVSQTGLEKQFQLMGATHEVDQKLSEADWFILPSTNEPCSVALMEALSLGVPAIVSRSGGCVDIVHEHKTGLFFEPENAADLALKLADVARRGRIMSSPQEIRESVRHRSATRIAECYGDVYKGMIQDN